MDEDTKRRFDAIVELWKQPWQRISERRSYEWRVAFTLWTALAAFIGLVVTGRLSAPRQALVWAIKIIGLIVCVLHAWYLCGLGKAHDTDRHIAIHYERILQVLANAGFEKDLAEKLEGIRKKQGTLFGDWSRRIQIAVTILIYCAAILAALATDP